MKRSSIRLAAVLGCAAAALLVAPPAHAFATPQRRPHPHRKPWPVTITVRTLPALPGVWFTVDGRTLVTDASGRAGFTAEHNFAGHALTLLDTNVIRPDRRYRFARWAGQRDPNQAFRPTVTGLPMRANYTVTAAFVVQYPVSARLVDQHGAPLALGGVSAVTVKSDSGAVLHLPPSGTVWLDGVTPEYRKSALVESTVYYSVQALSMGGANIVDAGKQRFTPADGPTVVLTGQLHDLTVTARDALFRGAVGTSAVVTGPDGIRLPVAFDAHHEAVLHHLPRGAYHVTVRGAGGIVLDERLTLSRDRSLRIAVLSTSDIATVGGAVLGIAATLLLLGRLRRRAVPAGLALTLALPLAPAPPTVPPPPPPPGRPPALLAFYYVWFDPSSWYRAKTDYPLLGNYSSDDPRVMRQHIEWAKSAGIDGFIVSWKDTATNDRRLRLLMGVAAQLDFKLAMIYQGLDFNRKPLPANQVAADFATFRDQYASDPVFFRLGGKPLTIWSGTWSYSHPDVARVTAPVRGSMLVLNTEKSVDGYRRLADVTDGDAYYWSSVNPATNDNYGAKLDAMSAAIHGNHQYWIAPFAPGFDARLVGGSKAVVRDNGATLRAEFATALRSSPDVLGLISWNEFSENSYVEPSQRYGSRYLDVLRELRRAPPPPPPSIVDSEDPAAGPPGPWRASPWPVVLLVGFPVLLIAGLSVLGWRLRRRARARRRPVPRGADRAREPELVTHRRRSR